ncbi:uncharacterized protein LOC125538739 [Triticum urartu]|uniref:uncharacterized protein LOC125538739 n=1 Tax=Triticum urartu TaxID=4572 RepID=UPI002042F11A|nr:uncharacterized protein LOC125538739 [Triticum urartu]
MSNLLSVKIESTFEPKFTAPPGVLLLQFQVPPPLNRQAAPCGSPLHLPSPLAHDAAAPLRAQGQQQTATPTPPPEPVEHAVATLRTPALTDASSTVESSGRITDSIRVNNEGCVAALAVVNKNHCIRSVRRVDLEQQVELGK